MDVPAPLGIGVRDLDTDAIERLVGCACVMAGSAAEA